MPDDLLEDDMTDDWKGTTEEELEEFAVGTGSTIKVFGMGGGGSNTVTRLYREKVPGIDLIACNTDANHLHKMKAKNKILLGENLTKGQGAGGDPRVGEEATKESERSIISLLKGAEIVFVSAGLGGGTGTGSAHYIARMAKEQGALTIGVVTIPFKTEGKVRMKKAVWGLKKLVPECDSVIVIDNERLQQIAKDLPVEKAFMVADEVVVKAIKAITGILSSTRLINLDAQDLDTVMRNSGVAVIGIGYGTGDYTERVKVAVNEAITYPFLDLDLSKSTGILVDITAPDPTVDEATIATDEIRKMVTENAKIIFGTGIDDSLDHRIQVTMIITGLELPQSLLEMEDTDDSGVDMIS